MIIHVVKEGDSLYEIGKEYNVNYKQIAIDNEIPIDQDLVVGQTLIIIVNRNNNKYLNIKVNGYTFPNINSDFLNDVLPYLTYLSIFSYHVNYDGSLNLIDDNELISLAKKYKVSPTMVITNIGSGGRFDSDLAGNILNNEEVQNELIKNIIDMMITKGYTGLNIDFEYIYPEAKNAYINFLLKVKNEIEKNNYILSVALAPKTSDNQVGILYEAHDYEKIGSIADYVIIMTYEWGYSGGPARAVAPINLVENVIAYAVTRIPPSKILMGIPNYGYNWTLPYIQGNLAKSISNYDAVILALNNNQRINYDTKAETPYFNYIDQEGVEHEVWFEDARSILAKLDLVLRYNLSGVSHWTIDRKFPQNYLVLKSLFNIIKE